VQHGGIDGRFAFDKPEDLNHQGTLFAGQMAKWLAEAGLIAASRLVGRPEKKSSRSLHFEIKQRQQLSKER